MITEGESLETEAGEQWSISRILIILPLIPSSRSHGRDLVSFLLFHSWNLARVIFLYPLVVLQVFRDHFEGSVPALLFLSSDCTGTPFLSTADHGHTLASVVAIAPPGSTVYLAEAQATPQTITVGSELARDGSCTIPSEAREGAAP
jgi:hypothetical protein